MEHRVVHLSTVHTPSDVRIFHKMCSSLVARGYRVTFIVPCARDCVSEGIRIRALPFRNGRWTRIGNLFRMFAMARRELADIYHFHDPELIPVGMLLKLMGHRVIYDVHEDVPKQVLEKHWIPRPLRSTVSVLTRLVEWVGAQFWDGIVAATPSIARKFPPQNTITVQNFPLRHEIAEPHARPFTDRPPNVIYAGGVSTGRGIQEVVSGMSLLPTSLHSKLLLAGKFQPNSLQERLERAKGWSSVDFLGWCARHDLRQLMANARAGIVTFLPHPNHVAAQPNKLFEYMSAGLPVIASDFPLWRKIVMDNDCGILVDPANPAEIARAIQYLITHPLEGERMGERGRRAVEEKYNWDRQSDWLFEFYQRLLNIGADHGRWKRPDLPSRERRAGVCQTA